MEFISKSAKDLEDRTFKICLLIVKLIDLIFNLNCIVLEITGESFLAKYPDKVSAVVFVRGNIIHMVDKMIGLI